MHCNTEFIAHAPIGINPDKNRRFFWFQIDHIMNVPRLNKLTLNLKEKKYRGGSQNTMKKRSSSCYRLSFGLSVFLSPGHHLFIHSCKLLFLPRYWHTLPPFIHLLSLAQFKFDAKDASKLHIYISNSFQSFS